MFSYDKILCYFVVVAIETFSNYLSESRKDLSLWPNWVKHESGGSHFDSHDTAWSEIHNFL